MVRQDCLEDLKCYESKVRKGKTTRKKVGVAQSEEHNAALEDGDRQKHSW